MSPGLSASSSINQIQFHVTKNRMITAPGHRVCPHRALDDSMNVLPLFHLQLRL